MKKEKVYYRFNTLARDLGIFVFFLALAAAPSAFFMLAFVLNAHIAICFIALVAAPSFVIYCFMYKAEYWIDDEVLIEKLTPMFKLNPFLWKRNRTYEWINVEYYDEGYLYSEYFKDRYYLRLKFKSIKRKVTIAEGWKDRKNHPFDELLSFYKRRILKKYKVEYRKPKFNTEAVMKVLGIIRYWIAIVFFVAMFVLTLFYVFSVLFPSIVGDFKPKRLGDPTTWIILLSASVGILWTIVSSRKK